MVTLIHLHVCCGGFNTRAGSIIIGVMCILSAMFVILGCLITLTGHNIYYQIHESDTIQDVLANAETFQLAIVIQIILGIVEILISSMMVWGAVKKNGKLVYPWIVVNILQTGLVILALVTMVIYFIMIDNLEAAFIATFLQFVYIAFHGYLILVIKSFHTTLVSPTVGSMQVIQIGYKHPKEGNLA